MFSESYSLEIVHVQILRGRFFGNVDPLKIVFRAVRTTLARSFCPILMPTLPLSILLQPLSLTPVPLLSLILLLPFLSPRSFSRVQPLTLSLPLWPLSLSLPFPSVSLSLSANVSLRRLVTPGETLEPLPFPATLFLRGRPPPPASINPTNQEARICPFELSGWLAALCCTRNFV